MKFDAFFVYVEFKNFNLQPKCPKCGNDTFKKTICEVEGSKFFYEFIHCTSESCGCTIGIFNTEKIIPSEKKEARISYIEV